MEAENDTERAMADRTRSKTYDVLAVSSTVHKANADYLAGILRYASGRQDWRLWLFNPLADRSYGNVLPPHRASGVIANGLDEVPLETLRPRNRRACVVTSRSRPSSAGRAFRPRTIRASGLLWTPLGRGDEAVNKQCEKPLHPSGERLRGAGRTRAGLPHCRRTRHGPSNWFSLWF